MTNQPFKRLRLHFQVHYKKSKDEIVHLNNLIDWERRNSSWLFTQRVHELRVARYWGLTNIQWDNISDEEAKAEMIAFYNCENKMASYDLYLREIEQRAKTKKWPQKKQV